MDRRFVQTSGRRGRSGFKPGVVGSASVVDQILSEYGSAAQAIYLAEDDAAFRTLVSTKVSSWLDQSGNGNHASQGTDANRPVWNATGIDSKPSLDFAGSQWLLSSAIDLSSSRSIAMHVLFLDTDSGIRVILSHGSTGADGIDIITNAIGDTIEGRHRYNSTLTTARSAASFPMSSAGVVTHRGDIGVSTNEIAIYHDGSDATSTRANNNTTGPRTSEQLSIGARPDGSLAFNGSMSAVVLAGWSDAITGHSTEIGNVDQILMDYRSIT